MDFLEHKVRAFGWVVVLLPVLLSGCDSKPILELTSEQAVYESLFLEIQGDATTLYYLAKQTESAWFEENPFEGVDWQAWLDELGGVRIDLIRELYRVNRESGPLNWTPFITNAELLPKECARQSTGVDREKLCYVNEDQPHNGLGMKNGGFFRPYYTVSRVAFSRDGRYAIVKYSYHCARLCGAREAFVTFRLQDNRWQVVGGRLLWIS